MTDLKNQKRLASELLKCGVHRVRFDDRRLEDITEAVTRADIRRLIASGAIMKLQKKGTSRGRVRYIRFQKSKGRRRGHGSRKGGFRSRNNVKKRRWIMVIRPIRARLAALREKGLIDKKTYRIFYRQAKGGMFKNKAHLISHLELKGLKVKEAKEPKQKLKPKKTKGAGPKEVKVKREKKVKKPVPKVALKGAEEKKPAPKKQEV